MPDRRFLVAAPAADGSWTTPVAVRCEACGERSPELGGAPAGAPDGPGQVLEAGRAYLEDLDAWAAAHECGPALSPDAWYRAVTAARAQLEADGAVLEADGAVLVRALAAALAAVWPDLRGGQ